MPRGSVSLVISSMAPDGGPPCMRECQSSKFMKRGDMVSAFFSRIVDPGTTLALSRRTTRRHFLLNPDKARQMEQIYWDCSGHAMAC